MQEKVIDFYKDKIKDKLFCINAGSLEQKNEFKKDQQRNFLKSFYLNYGLLGLATNLKEKEFNVEMAQADDLSPIDFLKAYKKWIFKSDILLIAIPSFYSLSWVIEFINLIKKIKLTCKLAVGGRWVIDNNLNFIENKIPLNVSIIQGCPDDFVELMILKIKQNQRLIGPFQYSKAFERLDYSILINYKKYQPVLEIARGCPYQCSFCLEGKYRFIKNKTAQHLIDEILNLIQIYQNPNLNIYLEGAIFIPTLKWVLEFEKLYKKYNLKVKFRLQIRAETIKNLKIFSHLANAGVKVIDIGLESASVLQLINMQKVQTIQQAQQYLNSAQNIIKTAAENWIWIKLNILLFPGETEKSINETINFLTINKKYIKGISANPLILYLNENNFDFIKQIEKLSQLKVNLVELNQKGYTFAPINKNFNVNLYLSKIINLFSIKDYNDLKKITYTKNF